MQSDVDRSEDQEPDFWNNPDVPVGNAPPMPTWPVIAAGLLWGLWIVFLVMMTVGRYANHNA